MDEEYGLTLDQVAERVGVHYQTVYRWVRAGRLPAVKIGGSYIVRSSSLEEFVRDRERPVNPPPPARARVDRQQQAMADALWEGDEGKVRSIARTLLSNGTSVTALIEQVVVPPLRDIGTAWHEGRLPIYVEHRASAIVERLLGEIMPNPRGRRRGRAVVAAVSGELHSLPTTMATAALRDDQWHVEHLGADVPLAELEAFVSTNDVDVAVISATNSDRSLAERAKRRLDDELGIPTIVGCPGATLTELQTTARTAVRSTP